MKKIYLDYNIILELSKQSNFLKKVLELKKKNKFYYSPAHIEELYRSKNEKYVKERSRILDTIEELTDSNELLPDCQTLSYINSSEKLEFFKKFLLCPKKSIAYTGTNYVFEHCEGIKETIESPFVCYERVSGKDTREIIENNAKIIMEKRENINRLIGIKEDLSNILPEELFENSLTKKYLKQWENIYKIKFLNKKLKFNYLKDKYRRLEETIEGLFHFLDAIKYARDKKLNKIISGIHDNTHCCYATKTDMLITTDLKMSKKTKAIYTFLGIKTQVIHIHFEKINEIFKYLG